MEKEQNNHLKKEPINIFFFYSRLNHHFIGILKALSKLESQVIITVVFWDKTINTPYIPEQIYNVSYYAKSEFSNKALLRLLKDKNPNIIYAPGWMDLNYLKVIYKYKKKSKVKVVAGIDDQWKGTIRQHFGRLVFKFWLKQLFDYLWVAGKPQYYYAKKMGYNDKRIISNLLSADSILFNQKANFSKRIVYLGRFSNEKGVLNLIRIYKSIPNYLKREWELVLIGDGPLKKQINIEADKFISVLPYLQSDALLAELKKGGIFCMPSNLWEMWGVAIHELAILGYPLLLSNICGANTEFLIDGYNGYSFNPNNIEDFKKKLMAIISLDQNILLKFAERSHVLGKRIDSEISAFSILSIMQK